MQSTAARAWLAPRSQRALCAGGGQGLRRRLLLLLPQAQGQQQQQWPHSSLPAQQAADAALTDALRASAPKVRPVNPKEAARGKVDYVQVRDWANGQADDIGELRVVPGTLGTGYDTAAALAAGARGGSAGAGAAAAQDAAPFYQQLGQHAQYLERQGALAIAGGPSKQPYRPFEAWQYTPASYSQYLAEVAAVHAAMEDALSLALGGGSAATTHQLQEQGQQGAGDSSSSSSRAWALPGRHEQVVAAYEALALLGRSSGLWRAAAAAADLQALSRQQQGQHKAVKASQNAVAYGRYLLQLANAASAATAAASSSSQQLSADEADGAAAALKLVAHAYALLVQQCLLGARIGAAATEQLQLLPLRAASLYLDYPSTVREPGQQLARLTDAAGQAAGATGRAVVMEELPKALQKSALMLAPLASASD